MIDYTFSSYLEIVFLLILIICAVAILVSNNLISITIYSGVFSMAITLVYLLMAAPDVAMTESSIGALISTAMLIKAMQITNLKITHDKYLTVKNVTGFFLLALFALMMIYAFAELPDYGQVYSPVNSYISRDYIKNTPVEIGIPSSVAAVLASYRGFDTLGETLVIMIAGIVIYFTVKMDDACFEAHAEIGGDICENKQEMTDYIRTILLPLSLVFAFYIQVHGEVSPGGGFQAGAILSSICIFYFIVYGGQRFNYPRFIKRLLGMSLYGFLIYLLMAIYTALSGGYFLEYAAITGDSTGHKIGIFIIEIGVGITVFSALLMIFLIFELKLTSLTRKEI